MIFGDYPCCKGDLCIAVPANAPGWVREECPHCKAPVWHYLSRLDPYSLTEADFLEKYEVDEATKSARLRNPPPPLTPEQQALVDKVREAVTKEAVRRLLYGGAP